MIIKRFLTLGALFSLSFGLHAASNIEDCSAITDNAKRLQCYDNFLQKQKNAQEEPQESAEQPAVKSAEPVAEESVEKTVTPVEPAETPEPELTAEEKFGSEQLDNAPAKKKDETDEIQTRAIGIYKMWEKGIPVTLENGQVWEITDNRSTHYMVENPKVTIEKTLFGGYLLGIEGLNKRFRVERKK